MANSTNPYEIEVQQKFKLFKSELNIEFFKQRKKNQIDDSTLDRLFNDLKNLFVEYREAIDAKHHKAKVKIGQLERSVREIEVEKIALLETTKSKKRSLNGGFISMAGGLIAFVLGGILINSDHMGILNYYVIFVSIFAGVSCFIGFFYFLRETFKK